MANDKSVEAQSHELQKIAHEITSEGINLDDQFQVAVIIDKLPRSWKDFKNQPRHKTKEFSLESLITRLRIVEEAIKQELKEEVFLGEFDHTPSNRGRGHKTRAKRRSSSYDKQQKFQHEQDPCCSETGSQEHEEPELKSE
ncbi:hypothetical protein LWI28_010085 [Acer negundo]|uniref:Uncharacterized protein n=1 Tax=Acer negundo TaxID=4023 RepID=A0AAD5IE20_ACENE|nr:hypothetical protein LWI28_010085 [Acer negundo]